MLRYLISLVLITLSAQLFAQSIVITSPNGGEVWQGCTTQNITWNASGTSQFYSIDYSTDNGSSWTSIATFYNSVNGAYSWDVPNIQSTQALIRVQDSNNNLVQDISNLTFSMAAPLILTSPNGGEVWEGGTSQTITWVASNTSNYFSLEYSLNGGNTWTYIDDYFYNTNGIFYWNVPNTPSSAALIRISDYNENCKQDQSNQLFEISPATATITVTSPSANQTLFHNEVINILWSSQFVSSNQVQIDYSADGGNTWNIISSITENDGVYAWTVPTTFTSSGLVRVTDLTNPATFDESTPFFSIAEPFINLTSPNGGEVEEQCESVQITWTHGGTNPTERFTIAYSSDQGANWTNIVSAFNQGNDNASSYTWQTALPEGPCIIRVSDFNNASLFDISDAPFTLTPNTDMIVTSPNGGEVLEVGTSYEITWADNNIAFCGIYYSIDNGANWIQIDDYDSSDGSRLWTVPNTPTTQGLIRIWDYNLTCRVDYSDMPFTIAPPTPVIVNVNPGNSPNQTVFFNENISITWASQYVTGPFVSIDYSLDNGATWTNVTPATENDGTFPWTVPAVLSSQALVRVSAVGAPTSATSTNTFNIAEPFINLTSPNGGEIEEQCESMQITWTHGGTNPTERFTIAYSSDQGATWTNIVSGLTQSNDNASSYTWQTALPEGPCIIRVSDFNNASLFDISDAPFTLTPNTDMIVTSPNGGEVLEVGTTYEITWADNNITYCGIYYSIDNGANWIQIDDYDSSDGSRLWTVPNTPTTQGLIRIWDYNLTCRVDYSDMPFTIAPPTPVIVNVNPGNSPNQTVFFNENISITWASQYVTGPFVSIDYSLDNGATWTNVTPATENDGTFPWTVPAVLSSQALVRVSAVGAPTSATSTNTFNIAEPFINLTSPNGGEIEEQCESVQITWTHGGTNPTERFTIAYSSDQGATWTNIVSGLTQSNDNASSYTWQTALPEGPCIIRVSDFNNASLFDISDAPFTLTPNTDIIVTSPNGGEVLEVGTSYEITWADNNITYCGIYYSIDNGANWVEIDSYDPSDGTRFWTVPNTPTNQGLIRIWDYNLTCRVDYSDMPFTIAPPTPVIVNVNPGNSPNQTVFFNENINITWASQYVTGPFVSIDYSLDNGATWTNVTPATENDGTFPWTVPAVLSSQALVRVSAVGAPTSATSTNTFNIAEPFINLTSPNGGEIEEQCESAQITWTHGGTNPTERFTIAYSSDQGATWTNIVSGLTQSNDNASSYTWQTALPEGPCIIRVSDFNNASLFDISDAPFTLTPNTDMIVTAPNGGEVLEVGTTYEITWADNNITFCGIYYSIDNGANWIQIDDYDSSDGSRLWTVPNTPTTQGLIRIWDYNLTCRVDYSDMPFTIAPPTPVIVNVNPGNSPNQTVFFNENISITWASQYVTGPFVSIDYSLDNGATWTNVTPATENDGTFPWTVPAVLSSQALIRVSAVGAPTSATSTNTFNIAEPFINLTSPNGGEVETQCESMQITWTHGGTNPTERFTIAYSSDQGATWTNIVSGLTQSNDNASSYTWQTALPEGPCIIRVSDFNNASLFDISDAPFTLTPNTDMIVTSPNGGEVLEVGTSYEITWADNNITYCGIYYSIDNGANWIQIDDYDSSDGSRLWTVPNTPTTQGLIRIWDYNLTCRVDYSDMPFTIVQPAPSLIYPNGGETVYQNQTRNITWTNTYFNSSFVKLEYSLDNGGSWTNISTAANNTGTYSWVVPALISQNALVRVSEFNNPSVFDVSDEVFSIEESIIVTSPNGDNGVQDWRVCTETTITWTSGGTSNYFKIFYSLNNGLTWTALETNYYSPGFTNAYDWVMPNSPGPGALVRVEDRFNAAQFDVSDANFTIAPAITVVSPNGGEVLGAGDIVSISWLNEGASNFYDIDYSINGGGSWNNIVFNQFIGGGSYDWVLPASLSSNYLIRVRDHVDNCKEDLSDSAFEVGTQSAAQIQFTNPSGGEDLEACESLIVTWNSVGTSNFFNLDYSLDGGLTWTNIVENHFTLSGTYNWSVPNFYSNNLILRVMDTQASAYNDQTTIPMNIAPAIANAGLDKNICLGESVFLQATGGVSYSWSPAIGLDDATINSPAASPSETTTYTLTITDQNGCQASDDIVVSVNTDCEISGCIDETAYNYNPLATTDSGFCLYTQGNGGGNNSVCPSDFNNDGITNLADLLIFLNNIGTVCSQ